MTEPIRPEDIRASDVDRKAAQERLHWAHAEGLISLEEFDLRVRQAWDARTRGDLDLVSADLPVPPPPPAPALRGGFAPTGGGTAMRVLFAIWASVSIVNLVIWGLVSATTGDLVHPWWVWVAAPPGAVLFTLFALGIGRADPPDRRPQP
ncbi:MAG TPA: DUF1707 domain-containing protein [Pseudonocardiaceae bacterium]